MAWTDSSMTQCNGQALTATTDTSSQGTHHKVSGEPTPRVQWWTTQTLPHAQDHVKSAPLRVLFVRHALGV